MKKLDCPFPFCASNTPGCELEFTTQIHHSDFSSLDPSLSSLYPVTDTWTGAGIHYTDLSQ